MLAVLNKKIYVVTWLRYTLWMPLYPVGIFLEGKDTPITFMLIHVQCDVYSEKYM